MEVIINQSGQPAHIVLRGAGGGVRIQICSLPCGNNQTCLIFTTGVGTDLYMLLVVREGTCAGVARLAVGLGLVVSVLVLEADQVGVRLRAERGAHADDVLVRRVHNL